MSTGQAITRSVPRCSSSTSLGREQRQPHRDAVHRAGGEPGPQPAQPAAGGRRQHPPHRDVEGVEHPPGLGAHGERRDPGEASRSSWATFGASRGCTPLRSIISRWSSPSAVDQLGQPSRLVPATTHDALAVPQERQPAHRAQVAHLEPAAVGVHVGLDQVDAGVQRLAQAGDRVAGAVRDRQHAARARSRGRALGGPRRARRGCSRRTAKLAPPRSRAGIQASSAVSATAPRAACQVTPTEARPTTRAPSRGLAPLTPGRMPATWLAPKTPSSASGCTLLAHRRDGADQQAHDRQLVGHRDGDAAQHDRQRRHRPAGEQIPGRTGGRRAATSSTPAARPTAATSTRGGSVAPDDERRRRSGRGRRSAGRARPRRRADGRFMPARLQPVHPPQVGAEVAPVRPGRAARSRRTPAGASGGCGRCTTARASAAGRAGTCRRPTGSRPSRAGCQEACGTRSKLQTDTTRATSTPAAISHRAARDLALTLGCERAPLRSLRSRHGLPGESTVVVGGCHGGESWPPLPTSAGLRPILTSVRWLERGSGARSGDNAPVDSSG